VLALVIEDGWREENTRQALDALRSADLVAQPDPGELLIALPNTKTTDTRVVEERLRQVVPKATIGVAPRRQDEKTVEGLLKRARDLAWRVVENPEATSC
jgi:PleD family two-component response regulator